VHLCIIEEFVEDDQNELFFFVEEKTTKIGRQGDTNTKRLL
jgi:hypothetical protein